MNHTAKISNEKLLEIIEVQTAVVQQGIDLGNIMNMVVHKAQHIVAADGAAVELVQNTGIVYSASSGMANKFLGLRLEIEKSLSGACIKERVPLLCNDIEADDRVNKEACRKIGLRSMIVVPLLCENEVVGILKVLARKVNAFHEDDIDVLKLMSNLIAAAMHYAIQNEERELLHMAMHDNLTGLSNRALFYQKLRSRAARYAEEPFAVVIIDMDGLKEINDMYGHRAGDAAIKELANRLRKAAKDTDTVSRLGGDEFGILSAEAAIPLLQASIAKQFMPPLVFEQHSLQLCISYGYASTTKDGADIEQLMELADQRMYEMKRHHKLMRQQ